MKTNTISAFNRLLREYELRLEGIATADKNEFKKEVELANQDVKEGFMLLRQIFPELIQVNYDSAVGNEEIERIVQNLRRRVEGKFAAELISTGETVKRTIGGTDFYVPFFSEWQSESAPANFVINYDKTTLPKAQRALNTLVGNMLISLPIKAVHLNFVDLNYSGGASLFTQNLDKCLYRDLVVSSQQLDDLCKEMQTRMVTSLQECGDLAKFNRDYQSFKYPYEVIVLLDYPNMYDYVSEQLVPLFKNGHKGGIYFVVMNNTETSVPSGKTALNTLKDCYHEIDLKKITANNEGLIHVTSLLDNQSVSKAIFKYINEEAARKPKSVPMKQDFEHLFSTPFIDTDSLIEVPVGKSPDGRIVSFQMDTVSHVHSFILGQSGSGKSVFLHNVIAASMLKYKPEDLQFYLLDFKLGGVEFNRYRNSKHVKALLVDNSDVQITLEILRDLDEAMKERGKALRAAGVSSVTEFNRRNPGNHLPQILLVADECHAMFNPGIGKNRKQFNEISEIIAKIAKEGRSQGVHLLLATQTLAETEISNEVLHNITDHYLLKCAAGDSERMVKDSSDKTAGLTTGQVYYHHVSSEAFFQSFYTSNQEAEKVTELIEQKAANNQTNGQFYFSGSQLFPIDRNLLEGLSVKRNPIASLGYSINLKREEVNVPLKIDDGENILFFGINDEEQVTRTVLNALITAIFTAQKLGKPRSVKVMDLLGFEDAAYLDELDSLKEKGLIDLVSKRDCGRVLYELATGIQAEIVEPTYLVILGQERLRGLKLDLDIEGIEESKNTNTPSGGNMFGNFDFESSPSSDKKFTSYRKAYEYILDNGSRVGVNALVQIDQPGKLNYGDFVSSKQVFSRFNHLVMLRSDEKAANCLQLNDEIQLETLSSDPERLRAFYYSVEKDQYQLFTPYVKTDKVF